MPDIRYHSKKFLTEFIRIYKSHPSLWKIKSKEYVNRHLKNAGYDALVRFYRRIEPTANRDFVRKKVQSLRGSFRKELRKIQQANQSGEKYLPTLWYFDLLLFTTENEKLRANLYLANGPSDTTEDALSDTDDPTNEDDVYEDEFIVDDKAVVDDEKKHVYQTPTPETMEHLTPQKPDHLGDQKTYNASLKTNDGLESDAFGKFVATKHARLDEIQKMYAECLITNILNKAILKQLTEDTTICEAEKSS